jgi:cytochrome c-type biogenesis protein CcmH
VTTFIIVCAVMLVAAIGLVGLPLLRREPVVADGQKARGRKAKGQQEAPRATGALAALAVALPLGAVAFYSGVSNFPWDNPSAAASKPAGHGEGDAASMAEVTQQLEARLAANPGDVEGWQMLGRTYLVTGGAAKAVTAYEKANELTGGGNPALQLDLAEALVLTDDPAVQDRAKKIVDAALEADSSNSKALWYAGVIALRADDKETAKAHWSKLLEQNPPDEIRQIVAEQLSALGVQVPAMAAATPAAMGDASGGAMGVGTGQAASGNASTASGRTLRIAVSVDPRVADKLKPGTPLFVSARQPGIPGPPLAAVRLTSDELPTTVVLSDANSMIEGRDLSSVDDVEVVARVAFGGTAVMASGDLIGTVQQKKGGAADVAIVIDQVAP